MVLAHPSAAEQRGLAGVARLGVDLQGDAPVCVVPSQQRIPLRGNVSGAAGGEGHWIG